MYTLVGVQAIVHKEKKRYFKQLRGKMLGGGWVKTMVPLTGEG